MFCNGFQGLFNDFHLWGHHFEVGDRGGIKRGDDRGVLETVGPPHGTKIGLERPCFERIFDSF